MEGISSGQEVSGGTAAGIPVIPVMPEVQVDAVEVKRVGPSPSAAVGDEGTPKSPTRLVEVEMPLKPHNPTPIGGGIQGGTPPQQPDLGAAAGKLGPLGAAETTMLESPVSLESVRGDPATQSPAPQQLPTPVTHPVSPKSASSQPLPPPRQTRGTTQQAEKYEAAYQGSVAIHTLIPTGSENWWYKLLEAGEATAPAVIAVGIGFLAPELIPAVPEILPELDALVVESGSAADVWASLSPHIAEAVPSAPNNWAEAWAAFKKQLEHPRSYNTNAPPFRDAHKTGSRAADTKPASQWLAALTDTYPDYFSNGVDPVKRSSNDKGVSAQGIKVATPIIAAVEQQPGVTTSTPDVVLPNVVGKAVQVEEHHPAQRPDKKAARTMVRFGDHSINTEDVTSTLLMHEEGPSGAAPNFLTAMSRTVHDAVSNFQFLAGHGYQIGSQVSLAALATGIDAPFPIWGTVLNVNPVPIPNQAPIQRHDMTIQVGPARELYRFTESAISALTQGGVPSEKYFISAVNPNLRISNLNALKGLTQCLEQNWECYDNSLLYAKLVFYALLRDLFDASGDNPANNAWPGNNELTWINIANEQLDPGLIPDAITRKDIVLIEGTDIQDNAHDLLMIYYLATSGMRWDGLGEHNTPHQCYIHWPAIPITVLARRAAPAQPAIALITANQLFKFAKNLAIRRNENSSYLKGVYIAMEMMGMHMQHDGDHWRFLRSNLSPNNPVLPRTQDYNFIFRLLHLFPPTEHAPLEEASVLSASPFMTRVRLTTLYNAVIATATTTLLYDLNITAHMLLQFTTGAQGLSEDFIQIMSESLNNPLLSGTPMEPVGLSQPRAAFNHWLDCVVYYNMFYDDTWMGSYGANATANHAFQPFNQQITPALFNPLAILDFMKTIPCEWGLCSLRPTMDLSKELKLRGGAAVQGWYSRLGSRQYQERAASDLPMEVVVYGPQVINVLTQMRRLDAAHQPVISQTSAMWIPQGTSPDAIDFEAPQVVPAANLVYIAGVHAFRPCSIMSYDYAVQEVRAPALLADALGPGEVQRLGTWTGQTVSNAGVLLHKIGNRAPPLRLPGRLNMMRIGAVAYAKAGGAAAAAAPDAAAPAAAAAPAGAVNPP